jgi:hypothetical protein
MLFEPIVLLTAKTSGYILKKNLLKSIEVAKCGGAHLWSQL